jgi:hypothetical protein
MDQPGKRSAAVHLVARRVDLGEVGEAIEPRDPGKSGLFHLPPDDDSVDRFPPIGKVTAPFGEVMRVYQRKGDGFLAEKVDDMTAEELPDEVQHLLGGSNYGRELQHDQRIRDLSMGEPDIQFARMLDAHG